MWCIAELPVWLVNDERVTASVIPNPCNVVGLSVRSFQLLTPPPASAFNVPSLVIVRFLPTFIQPNADAEAIGKLFTLCPVV